MITLPTGFRPMLADKAGDLSALRFPLFATPKIDGIRCLTANGTALARSLKPIRNNHIRETLSKYQGFDGEIIVGNITAKDVYQKTQSAVNSVEGKPDFSFWVFDHLEQLETRSFRSRMACLGLWVASSLTRDDPIWPVSQTLIENLDELQEYETKMLTLGYEGVMLRSPIAPYKFGRSTVKEGYLLKLKRFTDTEATIVGFEELMHNDNTAETNELGLTKRSSHQENKRPGGTLGSLIVKADGFEKTFGVGTGFTAQMKQYIWDNRTKLLGKMIKIKYQECGVKDVPRIPVFLGFRDKDDL